MFDKLFSNIWDTAERVLWTAIAGALTALQSVTFDFGPEWAPLAVAANTLFLIAIRKVISWLPNPGDGLPGLPTET